MRSLFISALALLLSFSVYAETVSLDTINAGIRRYDSKIKTVRLDGVENCCHHWAVGDLAGNITASGFSLFVTRYSLIYEGEKQFLEEHSCQAFDPETRQEIGDGHSLLKYVFDGKRAWKIHAQKTKRNTVFTQKGRMDVITHTIAHRDPRYDLSQSWNHYESRTLDEYLAENKAQVVGEEEIEIKQDGKTIKERCYLVSFENGEDKSTNKLWISKRAFRLVKRERSFYKPESDLQYRSVTTIVYKEFPGEIWYPVSTEWDASNYSSDGVKHPSNIGRIMFSNIEINSDVSGEFKFDIPPDAKIHDFDTKKTYQADEISSIP